MHIVNSIIFVASASLVTLRLHKCKTREGAGHSQDIWLRVVCRSSPARNGPALGGNGWGAENAGMDRAGFKPDRALFGKNAGAPPSHKFSDINVQKHSVEDGFFFHGPLVRLTLMLLCASTYTTLLLWLLHPVHELHGPHSIGSYIGAANLVRYLVRYMWTVRNIAAVIWIESRDTAFYIRKPYVAYS